MSLAIAIPHTKGLPGMFPNRVTGKTVKVSTKYAVQVQVAFKYKNRARVATLWMKPGLVDPDSDGGYLNLTDEGFDAAVLGVKQFVANEEDERSLG